MTERIEYRVMVGWPRDPEPECVWLLADEDAPLISDSDDVNLSEHAARTEADHYTSLGTRYATIQTRRVSVSDWEDLDD